LPGEPAQPTLSGGQIQHQHNRRPRTRIRGASVRFRRPLHLSRTL